MSRNYILKLEEVTFTDNNHGFIATDISEYFPDGLEDLTGTILEIGGEKFLYSGNQTLFTRDGTVPESDPEELAAFADAYLVLKANKYPVSGAPYTLSVYFYTEEESWAEKVGLPEMNVVHEHKETAKNDIEEIIQAIYSNIRTDENSIMEELNIDYPGYSPMDRLVIAVALFFDVDVTTVLAAGYPNQLKKIAAIIRGDVLSDSSILDPGESPGKIPGLVNNDEVGPGGTV